jgi:hypothetical protein
MDNSRTTEATSHPEARRLAHQLRNHLFTISMGIKSLELTRTDPDRFASVVEQIRTHAIGGIEEIANALDQLDSPASEQAPAR